MNYPKVNNGGRFFGGLTGSDSFTIKPRNAGLPAAKKEREPYEDETNIRRSPGCLTAACGFSGCDGGTRPSSSAPDTQGSGDSTPSSVSQSKEPEEEPYVVNVMNIHSAKTEDCEEVSAYISSLTRDLVGAEVQIIPGITSEQINLALTSGEKWISLEFFPGSLRFPAWWPTDSSFP